MKKILFATFLLLGLSSCSKQMVVNFLCDQDDVQIFVNDEYVGQGLVQYVAPKGTTTAEVVCKRDGLPIFSKNFYIKGYNRHLFDIHIPNNTFYSSDRQIHSK